MIRNGGGGAMPFFKNEVRLTDDGSRGSQADSSRPIQARVGGGGGHRLEKGVAPPGELKEPLSCRLAVSTTSKPYGTDRRLGLYCILGPIASLRGPDRDYVPCDPLSRRQ